MPAKRVSDSRKVVASKKQKLSPEIAGVLDVIAGADHLTPEVKQMLVAGCSDSLGVYADKRHAYQDMVVSMIGEVMMDTKQNLELKVSTAAATISRIELTKNEVCDSCKQAECCLQNKVEEMEKVENELFAISDLMMSATNALEEAKTSEKEGGRELLRLTSEKASLREALDIHLAAVLSGSTELVHVDALMVMATTLKLEETLCFSLPNVFAKPADERGSFDALVLKELEQMLQVRIGKLDAAMNTEQPGVMHLAAVAAAADREAVDATAVHEHKVRELEEAREAHEQQLTHHGTALQAECDVELQLAKEIKERDVAKLEFDAFVNFPCECFGLLDARLSKQPAQEPEEPAQEQEPAKSAVSMDDCKQASVQSLEMPQTETSGIVHPDSIINQIEESSCISAAHSNHKVEADVAAQEHYSVLGA